MDTITLSEMLEFLVRLFGYGKVNAALQQIQLAIQQGKLVL